MILHSKPLMKGQEKQLTTQQLIKDFCSDLEKGDFGLSKIIKKGYILYGQTRSGKTAVGHLLSGNPLKGVKYNGDQMVKTITSKNKNAIIGNTPVSQTRVPNIFEVNDPNNPEEKANVIDTPGYGDTNGIFRILQNGYYHYKMYSKIQNMKFILCFDTIQLQDTAGLFIQTIIEFTSYFKEYKDQKYQIWKSCVFLINKVPEDSFSLQDLRKKISEIQSSIKIQKRREQIDLIKQFIRYILDNDRIVTIKKYKPGESATRGDLLKTIDSKIPSWWSRQLKLKKKQQEVDMSKILFNITKPILIELQKNQLSKEQFISLIYYYNSRVTQILQRYQKQNEDSGSLDYILNQVVKDAMGEPDWHNFLNVMKRYVDRYSHIYDPKYKEPREKLQKEIFTNQQKLQVNQSFSGKSSKIRDKNFIVKKFNFLEIIQKKKCEINVMNRNENDQRTLTQKTHQTAEALFDMIRQFKNIAYKRKNCSQIIFKYGYLIYRVISQVEVILLLIEGAAGEKSKDKVISNNKIYSAADENFFALSKPLTDFMGLDYKYKNEHNLSYQCLLEKYIRQVNLNSEQFNKVTINWPLLELFSSTKVQDDLLIIEKIIILLQKFSQQFLTQSQNNPQNLTDTCKLIERLTTARVNCYELYQLTQDQDRKTQYFFISKNITENIGKLLLSIKKYSLARKVYSSIIYVDSVCKIFQEQIKDLKIIKQQSRDQRRTNENKPFRLRIQYGNHLKNYGREKEAIIIFQEAFELASNKEQLQEIRKQLIESSLQKAQEGNQNRYEQNLFQSKLIENFDEELIQELQNLGINNMPPSQIMVQNK